MRNLTWNDEGEAQAWNLVLQSLLDSIFQMQRGDVSSEFCYSLLHGL
jgi:hypothetical protein